MPTNHHRAEWLSQQRIEALQAHADDLEWNGQERRWVVRDEPPAQRGRPTRALWLAVALALCLIMIGVLLGVIGTLAVLR